jgi:hypothetical protein
MDGEQRIAMVETRIPGEEEVPRELTPKHRYQLSNHLGSSCLELDRAAEVITYEEYHPYGTSSYDARLNRSEVSHKRYRYTGKENDHITGLLYCSARYYFF